jgi:hypothetical protein
MFHYGLPRESRGETIPGRNGREGGARAAQPGSPHIARAWESDFREAENGEVFVLADLAPGAGVQYRRAGFRLA